VLELAVPLSVTSAPAPALAGVMLPDNVYVVAATEAVKFTPVTLALFTVTDCVVGLKLYPVLLGVTA
jgi:hypothetical protein